MSFLSPESMTSFALYYSCGIVRTQTCDLCMIEQALYTACQAMNSSIRKWLCNMENVWKEYSAAAEVLFNAAPEGLRDYQCSSAWHWVTFKAYAACFFVEDNSKHALEA